MDGQLSFLTGTKQSGFYIHIKPSRDGRVLVSAWAYDHPDIQWVDEVPTFVAHVVPWDELHQVFDELAGMIYNVRPGGPGPGAPNAA